MKARRSPWAKALLTLVLAAGASGCGVPQDNEPRAFEIGGFLSDLEAAELEGRDPSDTLGTQSVSIFLIRGDRLVERPRSVNNNAPEELITQLLSGPTEEEIDSGFRSALSAGARLRGVGLEDRVATVDIGKPFTDVRLTYEEILALGQLVMTVTGVPGVDAVRLALDGVVTQPISDVGVPIRGPVTREDYKRLLGEPAEETNEGS